MALQSADIHAYFKEHAPLPTSAVLADVVERYPYAPLVHFLYLRALQEEDSYKFPQQLHRTAVATMDRQALLDWAEAPLIPVEVQAAAWQKKREEQVAQVAMEAPKVEVLEAASVEVLKEAKSSAPEKTSEAPVTEVKPSDVSAQAEKAAPTGPKVAVMPKSKAEPTKLSDINLDNLPPAVRAQVERSRAIQAKLGIGGSPAIQAKAMQPIVPPAAPATEAAKEAAPVMPKLVPKEEKVMPPQKGARTEEKGPLVIKEIPKPSEAEPELQSSPSPTVDIMAKEAKKDHVAKTKPASPRPLAKAPVEDPSLSPFANFLMGLKHETVQVESAPMSERDPAMERAILEQFLALNPKIKPVKDSSFNDNIALRTPNVSGLVTETLANHYFDQGMREKAIQAYEILKLKVPEKSAIFAARISEMRNA
jgi:hypothetical protein